MSAIHVNKYTICYNKRKRNTGQREFFFVTHEQAIWGSKTIATLMTE